MIRKQILDILEVNRGYNFDAILAGIVIAKIGYPYLNKYSVRLCFELKTAVQKELQEMLSAGLIILDNDHFKKVKNANQI